MAKFKPVSLRFDECEHDALKTAATAAGESVAGYIKNAIRDRMHGRLLPDDVRKVAIEAAEAAGESPDAWLRRAVKDTSDRDRKIREMFKR